MNDNDQRLFSRLEESVLDVIINDVEVAILRSGEAKAIRVRFQRS